MLLLLQAYSSMRNEGNNVKLKVVPVTINYERVFEERDIAASFLGQDNAGVTFSYQRLFKAIRRQRGGKLGQVKVVVGDPVSLQSQLQS